MDLQEASLLAAVGVPPSLIDVDSSALGHMLYSAAGDNSFNGALRSTAKVFVLKVKYD